MVPEKLIPKINVPMTMSKQAKETDRHLTKLENVDESRESFSRIIPEDKQN